MPKEPPPETDAAKILRRIEARVVKLDEKIAALEERVSALEAWEFASKQTRGG